MYVRATTTSHTAATLRRPCHGVDGQERDDRREIAAAAAAASRLSTTAAHTVGRLSTGTARRRIQLGRQFSYRSTRNSFPRIRPSTIHGSTTLRYRVIARRLRRSRRAHGQRWSRRRRHLANGCGTARTAVRSFVSRSRSLAAVLSVVELVRLGDRRTYRIVQARNRVA